MKQFFDFYGKLTLKLVETDQGEFSFEVLQTVKTGHNFPNGQAAQEAALQAAKEIFTKDNEAIPEGTPTWGELV